MSQSAIVTPIRSASRALMQHAAPATSLHTRFVSVRQATMNLAAGLSGEDCALQSMPDASPVKWHLAHTTWFFETFVLEQAVPRYRHFHPQFRVLFNSYYVGVGERHPRPERGLLSRPTLEDVLRYRVHVDAHMAALLEDDEAQPQKLRELIELGLHHEQQHQELILMDILHAFSRNPGDPAYDKAWTGAASRADAAWLEVPSGLYMIGHEDDGFAFDNESARHRVWLDPFEISDRLVTAGEYRAFIEDGGYVRPNLWLSDGWAIVEAEGWQAPLYWRAEAQGWNTFSLAGRQPIDDAAPVTNVSYYEAEAYARWAGARLPSEAEWEVAATQLPLSQIADSAWQWTASAYLPYPGFRRAEGAVGEYNGKFMINQMVLRGGASITPAGHARRTYRNFFPPSTRWAFSGIRLARDA